MKKIFILVTLLALSFGAFSCGGGGAGSTDTPAGENPGVPSVVQLSPSHFVAQTNSSITLHAKVLDGNGVPIKGVAVTFTNLSEPFGVITGAIRTSGAGSRVAVSVSTVNTDDNGIATISIFSTTPGFATIQAEVNSGVSDVRERKTVFFTSISSLLLRPTLTLDVDDGDGIFDEPADFTLFKNANDNTRLIRATVSNGLFLISGSTVTFGADRPFKVGTDPTATCSDGSSICDVIFPDGNVKVTDSSGQAFTTVEVVPTALSSIESVLNITALADNGAFNMVSLFLEPVGIAAISVFANPTSVASGGTADISAKVTTTAGTPAPDGTTVNFTTNKGGIDPFAQTTGGIATAKFTAPTVTSPTSAHITASVGSVSGSVDVPITVPPPTPPTPAALAINPPTASSIVGICATFTFTITGGTSPYTTSSSNINRAFNDNGAGGGTGNNCVRDGGELGIWTGASIKVTVPATATAGTVDLNVSDSAGGTAKATITIQ